MYNENKNNTKLLITQNVIRYLKAPILKVDSDIDKMLHLNRRLLSVVGAWPLEPDASYSTKMFSLLRIIATCVFCTAMMVMQLITLYINWGDINVMTEIGCMLLGFAVSYFTYLYAVHQRSDFCIAYKFICEFWNAAENQEERNNIVELANHSRICTIVYFYLAYVEVPVMIFGAASVTFFNYVTANGTDYDRQLPIDLYYGIYCQMSPNYEIIFVIQSLALFYGATAAAGVNSTTMSIIMHIAGQFRVVSLRLKAIGQIVSDGYQFQNKPTNVLARKIKLCIIHHERVLSVFEFVNDLVGPAIFGLFIIAGIEICFTGWAIMKSDSNVANTIKFVILLMIVWLSISLWSWPGEMIIQESSNIGHAAFQNIPWYILPCSVQRDLGFIVRRAQRQSQLDAMGFEVMHLRKLTEVSNTAASYMALLRSIKE